MAQEKTGILKSVTYIAGQDESRVHRPGRNHIFILSNHNRYTGAKKGKAQNFNGKKTIIENVWHKTDISVFTTYIAHGKRHFLIHGGAAGYISEQKETWDETTDSAYKRRRNGREGKRQIHCRSLIAE